MDENLLKIHMSLGKNERKLLAKKKKKKSALELCQI